jgi:hypothetical protein
MACSTGKTKLSVRFPLIDDAYDRRRNDVRASASSCPIWKLRGFVETWTVAVLRGRI